jgi:hypothetical protein
VGWTAWAHADPAHETCIVSDGQSSHVIVLSEEASVSEQYAAEELQKYLAKMSGCPLPVRKEGEAGDQTPSVCIGVSRRVHELLPDFDIKDLQEEGIAIRTDGDNIVLLGSRTRGALYATYTFLEKLGVRFYSPDIERVPQRGTITFPETQYTHQPSFHYRLVTYLDALRPEYSPKLKINLNPLGLPKYGGNKGISVRHMTHTFYQLVPPEQYFDAHPEYFALVDGARRRDFAQLCLTNPETIRIATETVLKWMDREPQSHTFGVVQNDCLGWCECDACRALDEREESHAGSLIYFCNEIAKTIAKVHPNVNLDGVPEKMIHTIAYTYSEKPPKNLKPEPNLAVVLCHMYPSCDSHPIRDCPLNARYRENAAGWLAKTQHVLAWHYVVDFTHFCLPFPNFNAIRADLPWYKEMGLDGVLCQAAVSGEMSELRHYICAKLLWDTHEDVDALIDDFMEGYFGPAAKPMRAYFNLLHEKVRDPNVHMHLYSGLEAGYLPPDIVDKMTSLFDEAETLVKEQPEYLKRVRKERMGEWYTRLIMHPKFVAKDGYIEAVDRAQRAAWLEAFLKTARENRVIRHCEDLPLKAFEDRQRFLCEPHSILSLAEFAPTIKDMMDEAFAEAQRRAKVIDGKPYVDVIEMRNADVGKWFGENGLVELEHFLNEYTITQRSPFNIWTRYLSQDDFRAFNEPRLEK